MTNIAPRLFCSLAITTIFCSIALHAQPNAETPEMVARRYIEVMQRQDWKASTTFMHPDGLREMQRMLVEIAELDTSGEFREIFFGEGVTAKKLRGMATADVYTTFLSNVMSLQPELASAMDGMRSDIIGHVSEGDSLVHVVYRMYMDIEGADFAKMATISMKRFGSEWRLLLNGDMRNMANALRRQLAEPDGGE